MSTPRIGTKSTFRIPGRCVPAILLGLALCAPLSPVRAGAGETPGQEASVRITSPRAGDVAYGPVSLEARVVPPPGLLVVRVDLFADGVLLARDLFPPYRVRWDAGTAMASHVLRAVAAFSNGSTGSDLITTRGLSLTEHEVVESTPIEHVELLASVTDARGDPVRGLHAANFQVSDGGVEVKLNGFTSLEKKRNEPLSLTILVDRSGSMRTSMREWRDACLELLKSLRPIDQIRVTAFSGEAVILQDFTRDYASLAASLENVGPAGGSTSLFEAIYETVRDMRDLPGRKAIIVLTDGLDTDYTSPSAPVTTAMYAILQEIARMASRSGVTVFLILPGPTGRTYLAVQDLALQTGGSWMYPSDDLGALMSRLGKRMLASYLLDYDVARPKDPDHRRKVQVELRGGVNPSWEVHAELGVYGQIPEVDEIRDDFEKGNDAQRARAVRELGRTGAADTGGLILKALKDPASVVRQAALAELAERRDPATLEDVLDRLHDANEKVRKSALKAAVAFGSPALARLEKESGRRGEEGRDALRAIGSIGDPKAFPAIRDAFGSGDCTDRAAAADAAGNLLAAAGGGFRKGPPDPNSWEREALDLLHPALQSPCQELLTAAAIALGRLGKEEARPVLLALAERAEPPARLTKVLSLLRAYPGSESIRAVERFLDANEPIRTAARRAAADLYATAVRSGTGLSPEEGVDRLVRLGGDEAQAALQRLGRLEGPAGGPLAERIEKALASVERPPASPAH